MTANETRRTAPAEGFPKRPYLLPSLFLALSVILSCWWIPTLSETAGALREYSEMKKRTCESDTTKPVTRPAGRR